MVKNRQKRIYLSTCFLSCFSTGLKGSGEISLESLNHENTVMGRVSAQPGSKYSYDIEYTLRIREPVQAKRKKFAVFKLDKMFPKLDVNAKLPVPNVFKFVINSYISKGTKKCCQRRNKI